MRHGRALKWLGCATCGVFLLQITACLGPDPALLVTTAAVNAIVANAVAVLFNALLAGAA